MKRLYQVWLLMLALVGSLWAGSAKAEDWPRTYTKMEDPLATGFYMVPITGVELEMLFKLNGNKQHVYIGNNHIRDRWMSRYDYWGTIYPSAEIQGGSDGSNYGIDERRVNAHSITKTADGYYLLRNENQMTNDGPSYLAAQGNWNYLYYTSNAAAGNALWKMSVVSTFVASPDIVDAAQGFQVSSFRFENFGYPGARLTYEDGATYKTLATRNTGDERDSWILYARLPKCRVTAIYKDVTDNAAGVEFHRFVGPEVLPYLNFVGTLSNADPSDWDFYDVDRTEVDGTDQKFATTDELVNYLKSSHVLISRGVTYYARRINVPVPIKFTDAQGTVISSTTLSLPYKSKYDKSVLAAAAVAAGYEVVSYPTGTVTATGTRTAPNVTEISIPVRPKTYTVTYKYVDSNNGNKTIQSVTKTVTYGQNFPAADPISAYDYSSGVPSGTVGDGVNGQTYTIVMSQQSSAIGTLIDYTKNVAKNQVLFGDPNTTGTGANEALAILNAIPYPYPATAAEKIAEATKKLYAAANGKEISLHDRNRGNLPVAPNTTDGNKLSAFDRSGVTGNQTIDDIFVVESVNGNTGLRLLNKKTQLYVAKVPANNEQRNTLATAGEEPAIFFFEGFASKTGHNAEGYFALRIANSTGTHQYFHQHATTVAAPRPSILYLKEEIDGGSAWNPLAITDANKATFDAFDDWKKPYRNAVTNNNDLFGNPNNSTSPAAQAIAAINKIPYTTDRTIFETAISEAMKPIYAALKGQKVWLKSRNNPYGILGVNNGGIFANRKGTSAQPTVEDVWVVETNDDNTKLQLRNLVTGKYVHDVNHNNNLQNTYNKDDYRLEGWSEETGTIALYNFVGRLFGSTPSGYIHMPGHMDKIVSYTKSHVGTGSAWNIKKLTSDQETTFQAQIDAFNKKLQPLRDFVNVSYVLFGDSSVAGTHANVAHKAINAITYSDLSVAANATALQTQLDAIRKKLITDAVGTGRQVSIQSKNSGNYLTHAYWSNTAPAVIRSTPNKSANEVYTVRATADGMHVLIQHAVTGQYITISDNVTNLSNPSTASYTTTADIVGKASALDLEALGTGFNNMFALKNLDSREPRDYFEALNYGYKDVKATATKGSSETSTTTYQIVEAVATPAAVLEATRAKIDEAINKYPLGNVVGTFEKNPATYSPATGGVKNNTSLDDLYNYIYDATKTKSLIKLVSPVGKFFRIKTFYNSDGADLQKYVTDIPNATQRYQFESASAPTGASVFYLSPTNKLVAYNSGKSTKDEVPANYNEEGTNFRITDAAEKTYTAANNASKTYNTFGTYNVYNSSAGRETWHGDSKRDEVATNGGVQNEQANQFVLEPVTKLPVKTTPAGLATLHAPVNLFVPKGAEAYIVTSIPSVSRTTIALQKIADARQVIPANTAVVIKGAPSTTYDFIITTNKAVTFSATNVLKGYDVTPTTKLVRDAGGMNTFVLDKTAAEFIVFTGYKRAFRGFLESVPLLYDGTAPASVGAFRIDFSTLTAIESVNSDNTNDDATAEKAYDISGRRVKKLENGKFYILNGKKVIK